MGLYVDSSGRSITAAMYRTVAASQSTSQISTSGDGAVGDYLDSLVIIPASTSAGAVTLFDGTTTVMLTAAFPTGATNGANPYSIPIGIAATSTKGWNITTGAAVSVIAVGRFNR
jgi:hypothetical protein